ncbi:MAG: glutamate synthase large subunit [Halolamina sp.]
MDEPARGDANRLADPTDHRANCGVGVVMEFTGDADHTVVADSLDLLANLEHRGTTGAEENTGDGAGIVIERPTAFFADVTEFPLPEEYAVGTLFFPRDADDAAALESLVEETLVDHDLDVLGWRDVPTENADLGETARRSEPNVVQVFVAPDGLSTDAFDRALYLGRRAVETRVSDADVAGTERFYVCSLDRQIVVYKGLLTSTQLADYYPDLRDERVRSTFAVVHARFSTNTLGAWHLAHPFRRISHNGEFNTIQGNINWMRAREGDLAHDAFGDDIETVIPIIDDPEQSDTASVDNALELLLQGGRSLPHALRMLVPEAWRAEDNDLSEPERAFYDYHASLVEPWDGPALVIGTDGDRVAGVLDRNGLRPCRYAVADGRLVLSSEAGALELDPAAVEQRGRLQPGELFVADPDEGILPESEVVDGLTDERYAEWVAAEQVQLSDLPGDDANDPAAATDGGPATAADGRATFGGEPASDDTLRARQAAFGYTHDELDDLVQPMVEDGKDPVGSMGDDTPLPVLSSFNRPLSSYFTQRFAQVSNPPVDHIRERLVFSLETRLGPQRNLLSETPEHARQLVLDSPVLRDDELTAVTGVAENGLTAATLDLTFADDEGLAAAVERLHERATAAAAEHDVLVLSDRGVDADSLAIPGLLATAAVHHHLVRASERTQVGLVVETGAVRTVHQLATLVGYGAGAVNPYLALETVSDLVAGPEGMGDADARERYVDAMEEGLLTVMAKMGISTVESYRGAQMFDALGLDADFVAEYFAGTDTRTEGIDMEQVAADLRERHALAFEDDDLPRTGEFEFRSEGRSHQWNPETVRTLQQAVRNGDYEIYREFAAMADAEDGGHGSLRGLLSFDSGRESVPVEEVEPVADIVERFSTAAMSLGSISPEAHETNARAMNRLGAKSNTGEGGEPPERFDTATECTVKQVASGRFGVTNAYLASADELQIKMAQGSKPGEGGHLPGHKVVEHIAHTRQTVPGVDLISPPPQHDIYSIEDLKQLIYDLKATNPEAGVNVKLVSETGVGTIAAGVAKADADTVHISGRSGGTGASAKTSIKHAGAPWELGLAEANQMLHATGLRDRIRVAVDGGFQTGRDVTVAALLGAEEYVFGTASLVTSGCVMARACHTNRCPVGIATQDEDLRERFPGEPAHVVNYMEFIARDVRERLADLGFRSVEEMVGRVDALVQRTDVAHPSAKTLDLGALLADPEGEYDVDRTKTRPTDLGLGDRLDWDLIDACGPALARGESVHLRRGIDNQDRAVGATLSGRIAEECGPEGLADDTVSVAFDGAAGQSFGAFLAPGVTFTLDGVANDYVGKGLSGGKLLCRTPDDTGVDPTANTLVGNVALYGATDGECYVNGVAGERFAVRNSGAKAVVEGLGDHGCEYMTGGVVVALGTPGKNFAAGMSGGVAYVYDPENDLRARTNTAMVSLHGELDERDERMLRRLVENHAAATGSDQADALLAEWDTALDAFTKVLPGAYAEAVQKHEGADVRDSLPDAVGPSGTVRSVSGQDD